MASGFMARDLNCDHLLSIFFIDELVYFRNDLAKACALVLELTDEEVLLPYNT